jgi:pimeloyl-ACP methyl ester carboxylesterase
MTNPEIHVREWGYGNPKTAILIHGIAASSLTWNKVAHELVKRGYHVFAPDLYGHGDSKHNVVYNIRSWSNSVVNSVPKNPDLAIGHSLGGLILAYCHYRLLPKNTVFVDPAFYIPFRQLGKMLNKALLRFFALSEKTIRKRNPLWTEEEILIERDTLEKWDKQTISGLPYTHRIVSKYLKAPGKAIVLTAQRSFLVPRFYIKRLSHASIQVKRIIGAGHTIHRDKFNEFMDEIYSFVQA